MHVIVPTVHVISISCHWQQGRNMPSKPVAWSRAPLAPVVGRIQFLLTSPCWLECHSYHPTGLCIPSIMPMSFKFFGYASCPWLKSCFFRNITPEIFAKRIPMHQNHGAVAICLVKVQLAMRSPRLFWRLLSLVVVSILRWVSSHRPLVCNKYFF